MACLGEVHLGHFFGGVAIGGARAVRRGGCDGGADGREAGGRGIRIRPGAEGDGGMGALCAESCCVGAWRRGWGMGARRRPGGCGGAAWQVSAGGRGGGRLPDCQSLKSWSRRANRRSRQAVIRAWIDSQRKPLAGDAWAAVLRLAIWCARGVGCGSMCRFITNGHRRSKGFFGSVEFFCGGGG